MTFLHLRRDLKATYKAYVSWIQILKCQVVKMIESDLICLIYLLKMVDSLPKSNIRSIFRPLTAYCAKSALKKNLST